MLITAPVELTFFPPLITNVITEVRRIAAESPDFTYNFFDQDDPGCRYVKDGQGSCIVGKALVALGVPTDFFDTPAAGLLPSLELNTTINSKRVGVIFPRLFGWPRGDELSWLMVVQAQQDTGMSWGYAVATADRRVKLS
jgi:hypothetical protein